MKTQVFVTKLIAACLVITATGFEFTHRAASQQGTPIPFQDAVGTVVALTLTLTPAMTDTVLPTHMTSLTPTDTPTSLNTSRPTATHTPSRVPTLSFSPTTPRRSRPTAIRTLTPIPTPSFSSNLGDWTLEGDGGTWYSTNDGLVGTVARGTDSFYVAATEINSDFVYETTFIMLDGFSTAAAGVIFRSHPDPLQGCYMVRVSIFKGGEISLVKFFPTRQYQQIIPQVNLPINLNTQYTIRIEAAGRQIKVYLNRQLVLEAYDSSFEQGMAGLNVNSSTTLFSRADIR